MARALTVALLLLCAGAWAQDLPHAVKDTSLGENLDFIYEEVRKDRQNLTQNARTFTAAQTFGASVTLQGRIEVSTGAAVFLSTYSFGAIADFGYSSTTFQSSLQGSTHTITVPGGMRVRIWAQLNITGSADQIQMRFRVLEDGVAIGADEISSCLQSGGGGNQSQSGCSFSFERLPSGGQRTYSLQGRVGSGSVSNTSGGLNQFGVETVP